MARTAEGYKKTTRIVHGAARTGRWDYSHHVVPPLTASTTFRLESVARGARGFTRVRQLPDGGRGGGRVYIYDRLDEPTRELLESQLAAMEETRISRLAFASGMAAISAAMGAVLESGDEVVAHTLLLWLHPFSIDEVVSRSWGSRSDASISPTPNAVAKAITKKTRVLYLPNPQLIPTLTTSSTFGDIAGDVAKKASKGRGRGVLTVIDNTFCTPFGQRPMEHGIDLVVHSLTKNIGGFGTEIGGAVCGAKENFPAVMGYRKDFGGILSPKAAWNILVYGVPTIPLRIKRQQYPALARSRSSWPSIRSWPNAAIRGWTRSRSARWRCGRCATSTEASRRAT